MWPDLLAAAGDLDCQIDGATPLDELIQAIENALPDVDIHHGSTADQKGRVREAIIDLLGP